MLHFVATNDGLFLEDFDGVALVGLFVASQIHLEREKEGEGGERRGEESRRGRVLRREEWEEWGMGGEERRRGRDGGKEGGEGGGGREGLTERVRMRGGRRKGEGQRKK